MRNPLARFILAFGVLFGLGPSKAIAADADQAPVVQSVVTQTTALAPAVAELTAATIQPAFAIVPQAPKPGGTPNRGLRFGLYASFATLQALDAHSTLEAIRRGGAEANPFMRGVAARPAALVAIKAGTAAATVMLAEKLSKRNPVASVLMMTALNSAYATIVAHNYQVAR
jgi:hypothetical protein